MKLSVLKSDWVGCILKMQRLDTARLDIKCCDNENCTHARLICVERQWADATCCILMPYACATQHTPSSSSVIAFHAKCMGQHTVLCPIEYLRIGFLPQRSDLSVPTISATKFLLSKILEGWSRWEGGGARYHDISCIRSRDG